MPTLEARAANRLLCYAMLLAASYTMMRTIGDSLFLSRVGNDSLALVFVFSGIATAVIASIWYAATRRLSLAVSIKASSVVFFSLTLTAWLMLPHLHHSWWLLAAIYLLTEIKGCVNTINVVSAMNELLGGHSSRQAWARIGLGAPLAGIFVGASIGIEASFLDLRTWLLLSAILDAIAIFPMVNASKVKVQQGKSWAKSESSLMSSMENLAKRFKVYACSRQFRFWIGLLIMAKVIVLTLITFFWKVSVNDYFAGNEASLTRYFAVYYACIGMLTLLIQLFVTGRLISRKSLYVPILFMPVALSILCMIAVISLGAFLVLVLLTLAKSLEVWRRSVHDTTLNLLYTNIDRRMRRTAIAINTAALKPLAEVGASLVLLLGTTAWQKSVVVIALVLWVIAALALLRLVAKKTTPTTVSDRESPNQPGFASNVKQLVPGLFHH